MKIIGALVVLLAAMLACTAGKEIPVNTDDSHNDGSLDAPIKHSLESTILQMQELLKTQQSEMNAMKKNIDDEMNAMKDEMNAMKKKYEEDMTSMKRQLKTSMAKGIPQTADDTARNNSRSAMAVSGVTYTRWGRTVCPTTAQVVYTGAAAGSWLASTGGGTDYICLPETPQWGTVFPSETWYSSDLHGVEYEVDPAGTPFSFENNYGQTLNNQNAPCTVCLATERTIQLMIPAAMSCPAGWFLEYQGYLVTERDAHYKKSYVCADKAPEALPGGHDNIDGATWFTVESLCITLTCPPYQNYYEIACVVCTQ